MALFRDELRQARTSAGLTQEELAARVSFSAALIAAIETGRRLPSADFSKQCDELFGTDGRFSRIQARVAEDAAPRWSRDWPGIEKEAVTLRSWEPLVIPGILQTAEYAKEILRAAPGVSDEETERRLAERLSRQTILDREIPPMLFVVVDESTVRREIGGTHVMREQLARLLEAGDRRRTSVQVVPSSAGSHPGLCGGLVIAGFQSAPDVAYAESALGGQLIERPEDIAELTLLFDTIRGAALPCRASAELIGEVMSSWN